MNQTKSIALIILFAVNIFSITQSHSEDKFISIGWIGPLTGNAAVLGVDSLESIQMVFDEFNKKGGVHGYKLRLIAEDDQYSTSKTVSAYKKLTSIDKVKFIFVITYGGLFAIANSAEKDNVILLDPLDCDDAIGALNQNVLCIAKTTKSIGTLAAEHAVKNQNLPVGILYVEGDPFPITTAQNAKEKLMGLGVTPILYEGYSPETKDFKSLILRLKSAKIKSLFMYGYDEMGLIALQAKQLGLKAQIYSFGTVVSPGFISTSQGSADGAIIVMWKAEGKEKLANFLTMFKSRKDREPFVHISSVPSFDAANILGDCLNNLENLEQLPANQLAKCFYSLNNYQGASGTITMDPDGVTRSFTHSISIMKDGVLVPQKDISPN